MDFDDADGSSAPAPKTSRFVPKSKFQPKSKLKPAAPSSAVAPVQPKLEPSNDVAPPVSVKMEHDSDQPIDAPNTVTNENGAKLEIADAGEPMDVDAIEEERIQEEEEDFVVSEIDVYFNPSPLEEATKVWLLFFLFCAVALQFYWVLSFSNTFSSSICSSLFCNILFGRLGVLMI